MKRNMRGFTLAELLIVVAIIAVLVAIAIPVFTKQLEKKAVASFDVDCPVQVALEKISNYFHSVDNHISLARR